MAAPGHYDFDGRAPWIPAGGYVLKAKADRLEFWDRDLMAAVQAVGVGTNKVAAYLGKQS